MAILRGAQRALVRCLTSVSHSRGSSSQQAQLASWFLRPEGVEPVDVPARSGNAAEGRKISTSAPTWQLPQLDLQQEVATSYPEPGDDNESPPLNSLEDAAPTLQEGSFGPPLRPQEPHLPVAAFDLATLSREMSSSLSQGKAEEAVNMFEEWKKGTDSAGQPNKASVVAYNLLLQAKLRANAAPEDLVRVVDDMETEGLTPNLVSFSFVMRSAFRARNSEMAEQLVQRMEKGGPESQPDGDSYNFVVALCALHRRLDAALKHMQAMVEKGFVPSRITYNEVLIAAGRLRRTGVAVSVLKELKSQSVTPILATLAELLAVAAEVDDAECATLALQFMNDGSKWKLTNHLLMDEGGMIAVLSTAARTANKDLADQAWHLLKQSLGESCPPSVPAFLARLHAFSAAGDLNSAFSALHELEVAHGDSHPDFDPEVLSPFGSLMPLVRACSKGGAAAVDAAYFKLEDRLKAGDPVSAAAINCVILASAKIWDADRAYQTFDAMGSVFDLRPDVHSCNALLHAFGKSRKTAQVLQISGYMAQIGVSPDYRTHSLLIEAQVVNRDVRAAFDALEIMVSAGYKPSRELLQKMVKRCQREGDQGGLQELSKSLGPTFVAVLNDRRKHLLSFLP